MTRAQKRGRWGFEIYTKELNKEVKTCGTKNFHMEIGKETSDLNKRSLNIKISYASLSSLNHAEPVNSICFAAS